MELFDPAVMDPKVLESFLREFLVEMLPIKLHYQSPKTLGNLWVFWSQEECQGQQILFPYISPSDSQTLTSSMISEKIKTALMNPTRLFDHHALIQFWEAKMIGNRCVLTTSDQPFALTNITNSKLLSYRKHCMRMGYDFEVDPNGEREREGNGEEDHQPIGVPQRVFLNRFPECTPDVGYYCLKEYPQRDLALGCGIKSSLVVPVFEPCNRLCVGVLELVGIGDFLSPYFGMATEVIKMAHLESSNIGQLRNQVQINLENRHVKQEVKDALKEVCETHGLPLALTWVRCGNNIAKANGSMEELLVAFPDCMYYDNYHLDYHLLIDNEFVAFRKGQGPIGMAFLSQRSCFCRDVTQLSIRQYPLVHCVQKLGFTSCFAIFLRGTNSENPDVVAEFFTPRGNPYIGDPQTLLSSILVKMRKHFHSFEVVSGELINESFVEFDKFSVINEFSHFKYKTSTSQFEYGPLQSEEVVLLDLSDHQASMEDFLKNDRNVHGPEQPEIIVDTPEKETIVKTLTKERQKRESPCSLEILKQQFGMTLDDASINLGVSRSTIKRWCRYHEIKKWPYPKKKKVDHSLSTFASMNENIIQGIEERSSQASRTDASFSNWLQSHASDANGHPIPNIESMQDMSMVTARARYQDCVLKFPLSFSSSRAELLEEVTKRLKLEYGSFCMEYQDEDNEYILIACDADMSRCMDSLRSSGKTGIDIRIRHTSEVFPSQVTSSAYHMIEDFGKNNNNINKKMLKKKLEVKEDGENQVNDITIVGREEVQEEVEKVGLHPYFCDNGPRRKVLEQFIFDKARDPNQILVETKVEFLRRVNILESLSPKAWLHDGVINMATSMLTAEEEKRQLSNPQLRRSWYLPTYVYEKLRIDQPDFGSIWSHYRGHMGDVSLCDKICIPVNELNRHWYMCRIDFMNGVIQLLDSLPDFECSISRLNEVTKLRDLFAELLDHIGATTYATKVRRLLIQSPKWVPNQGNRWDCGLFIIKFMREEYGPNSIPVRDEKHDSVEERVKLAIDMVLHEANIHRKRILEQVQPFCTV